VTPDIHRGEIWMVRVLGQGRPRPVLVLSNDDYNAHRSPLVTDISDVEPTQTPGYVVRLGPGESPTVSWVIVPRVAAIRRQWFDDQAVGRVSATTMTRVGAALKDLFDLP
jgi:mRNA-degrading endonuclease toxin of MazEF toxin-antitoxin module